MIKLNQILSFVGSFLVLIGLLGPWFSLTLHYQPNNVSTYSLSPFIFSINKNGISKKYFFSDVMESSIGVVCILGAILGLVRYRGIREKLCLIGGILVIGSAFAFLLCLPEAIEIKDGVWSPYVYNYFVVGWGEIFTIVGGAIMIARPIIYYLRHETL